MKKSSWFLITLILAFCSLSYEFIMVKVMTMSLGGRIGNYNLIVSLFTFSLGMGTLFSEKVNKEKTKETLCVVEFLLSIVGMLSPALILFFPSLWLGSLFSLLIGFLSGFEFPLLLNIKPNSDSSLLGFDYLGMFLASIITPLIFFREIGIIPTLILVGMMNLLIAIVILEKSKLSKLAFGLFFFTSFFVIKNHEALNLSVGEVVF